MKKIDKPLYEHLGVQLKNARLAKKLSLQDVADKVGKSKTTIKRYEDATVRIDMDTLKKLGDLYDMQVMDVSTITENNVTEHIINLYPKLEVLLPFDKELQEAGKYWEKTVEKMSINFMHSDINIQKSILMMLNFSDSEIDEVMKFLHF